MGGSALAGAGPMCLSQTLVIGAGACRGVRNRVRLCRLIAANGLQSLLGSAALQRLQHLRRIEPIASTTDGSKPKLCSAWLSPPVLISPAAFRLMKLMP